MTFGYFLSVFFHIVFASFWIGGMLFLPLVVLPGIKNHPDRIALLYKTGMAFRLFGWVALGGLVLTGVLNLYLRGLPFSWTFFAQSDYGRLLSLKLLLFLATLAAGGVHDFYFGKKAL
ncbi:MAG TPA: CopD family protein, partial [Saprospiraceae bacterium]|nr:CopD family protein [Saprospiraceae bacterium]